MRTVEEKSEAASERSVAAVFAILWDALADLLGTAATATLIRRAAQRAATRCPELGELIIMRMSMDYCYTPPLAWKEDFGNASPMLELVRELRPLLIDLTGAVVINHLARTPELRSLGFVSAHENQS